MRATCPNNLKHKTFVTVAHVPVDWEVDEQGIFTYSLETLETIADPNSENTWTCKVCGAEAIVKDNP